MATNLSLSRLAARTCAWSERWFPDAFSFAVLAVAIVALAAMLNGASATNVANRFGEGFWSVIPFTMQMCFIVIGGYVTADSPPVARLTAALARLPGDGRTAVALVAIISSLLALIHWGLGLMFSSLLVRALARRDDLRMDYRAAGAAACVGIGTVWALGLSSSAAQLQANPASMPAAIMKVTGVIGFGQTIFLWQSMLLALVLIIVGAWIAWRTAPSPEHVRTARELGIVIESTGETLPPRRRPGEWLEYSPLLNLLVVALAGTWLVQQFLDKGALATLSSLNTYNLIFLTLALLLQWRPRRFLDAVARSVPSVGGILIQFPFLGAIAAMLTSAPNSAGVTLATTMSQAFTHIANTNTYAVVIGIYSAVLGLFVPSGGGKWLIEAPYVMQAAKDLHYNLGWAVQIYNAAESLPNLINPFWMLPVLGLLKLRAADLFGYTFVQFIFFLPLMLFLLWLLGQTLPYLPPVIPGS